MVNSNLDPHWLLYFVNWNFVGLGLYAFLGVILGLKVSQKSFILHSLVVVP